jgi:hypothetical protein
MPRARRPENEGLPARWQLSHGAYFYQVPPGLEYLWNHKQKYRLGATLPEAMEEFIGKSKSDEAARGIDAAKLLALDEIIAQAVPRASSGVYFLIKDERVIYVGRSANVIERIATHAKNAIIPFDSTHFICATGVEMDRLEQLYIGKLRPEFNVCFYAGAPD